MSTGIEPDEATQARPYTLETAARSATRWNAKQARALPLFHHAGILDQVVAPMTAERQLERRQHFATSRQQALAAYDQRAAQRIERYKALLAAAGVDVATIEAAWAACTSPRDRAYEADFYWQRLKRVCPDLRWEDAI